MIRKLRLTAAIVLLCAVFLPLSECSQSENHLLTAQKSVAQRLYPQTNTDFSYQYGYHFIGFDLMGLLTVLAFGWPLAFALFVRRNLGPRTKWTFRILDLLLCVGTIYWLDVLSYHSFGATWLYGEYVGVIAVAVFTCLGIAAWFVDREAQTSGPGLQATALVLAVGLLGTASARAGGYDSVKSAKEFAIGGIGVAGTLSQSEVALRELRDGPRAEEQLRQLLKDGTPAGRLYALYGLRQLNVSDYDRLAEPYRSNHSRVKHIQGCMISEHETADVVKWIDQYAKQTRDWEKKEPPQAK
jgi:hypothetical protein